MQACFVKMTDVLVKDKTKRPVVPMLRVFIAHSLQNSLIYRVGQAKASTTHIIQGGFDIHAHALIMR
jgi:hypothetical protein